MDRRIPGSAHLGQCPSATRPVVLGESRLPRVWTVSLNGFLGSPVESPVVTTYRRLGEITRPANPGHPRLLGTIPSRHGTPIHPTTVSGRARGPRNTKPLAAPCRPGPPTGCLLSQALRPGGAPGVPPFARLKFFLRKTVDIASPACLLAFQSIVMRLAESISWHSVVAFGCGR